MVGTSRLHRAAELHRLPQPKPGHLQASKTEWVPLAGGQPGEGAWHGQGRQDSSIRESRKSVGSELRAGLAEGRRNCAMGLTKGSGRSGEGGPLSERKERVWALRLV